MRDSDIPVKTEAGRREIGERRRGLQSRQRTLLIAIHGEHAVTELRRQFQAMGDVDAMLDELAAAGLIEPRSAAVADVSTPDTASVAVAPPDASARADEISATDDEALSPLQLARQFMNETAVAALGLRAFLFTLKLEKCYSKEELVALMPEYQRVMSKARNAPFANAMVQRATDMLDRI
jgi:hypothetical protein